MAAQQAGRLDCEEALANLQRDVDTIVATQRDVNRLPAILGQAVTKEEERLNAMSQQLETLKQQQQMLVGETLTAGPQARAMEAKLAKHIQDTTDQSALLSET